MIDLWSEMAFGSHFLPLALDHTFSGIDTAYMSPA